MLPTSGELLPAYVSSFPCVHSTAIRYPGDILERHDIAIEVDIIAPWNKWFEMKMHLQNTILDPEPDTAIVQCQD
ncbi:MAG: hypothetical protein CL912_27245 [Deltaproteobacteria bacterium]|nr:hypothetical protein [Deltaproteobacteria bacterium]